MAEFTYIARQADGNRVEGTITANDLRDATHNLNLQKLFPIEITAEKQRIQFSFGSVSSQQLAVFYSQMASLLQSGVPLLRSLKILTEQTSNAKLRSTLEDVSNRVEEGQTLGEAFAHHPKIFSDIAVNMTIAGGEGGFLEEALQRISQFTEQQAELRARTVGAMIYPMILMTVGTAIVVALLVFFVPKFGEMFDILREKGQLPAATEWLLGFSDWLGSTGWLWILAVIAVFVGLYIYSQSGPARTIRDRLKIKLPLFGKITRDLAISRFCRVLGTLLHNGVPILRSLEIARAATGNAVLSQAIEDASENITSGESLAVPLKKSGHFPRNVTEMITVSEESNTMDKVLVNISENLEKQTVRRLDLLVKMLEPLMLMMMAGVILFVVVALLLPIMKMSQAMQ